MNFFELFWIEISDTSVLERFVGGGIGADEQWKDFDSGSCRRRNGG